MSIATTNAQDMNSNKKKPNGIIGKSTENGLPVIWKFVNESPTSEKMKALPWLTVISWKYDGSNNNGMPLKAVNERMILLEETLEKHVEKADFCEHAISKTGSNMKELIYYIHNRDEFIKRLNSALKSHKAYPIEIDFYEDPEWKEHSNARSLFKNGEQVAPDKGASLLQTGTR